MALQKTPQWSPFRHDCIRFMYGVGVAMIAAGVFSGASSHDLITEGVSLLIWTTVIHHGGATGENAVSLFMQLRGKRAPKDAA